ncbi:MAG: ComEA family DNA-binding protein [Bacteroidia bacterium]
MVNKSLFLLKFVFVFATIFVSKFLTAQKLQPKNEIIASIIEKLIENQESQLDYTDLQAQLAFYFDSKINLNKCTENELQQLLFLKQSEINSIINHRKKYGNFESIYELQAIENLSDETIFYLKHFTLVNETNKQLKLSEISQVGKTEIIVQHENDFQQRLGYKTNELKAQNKQFYLGSPYRYVLRVKQKIGNRIDIGFTGEKDAGEQFFSGAQSNGFDYNSAHIHLKNVWNFKNIIIGDYQANFGQGLTFGSGLSARKSAYVLNVNRYFQNIRPYRSVNEFEFMRGAAIDYHYKSWQMVSFLSYKNINTNFLNADTNNINSFDGFTGFNYSGFNRTTNEILDKDNVKQTILGVHIQKEFKYLQLGFTGIKTNYSVPFLRSDNLYQKYNFTGNQLVNIGMDYKLSLGNALFSGEVSASDNSGFATTNSLLLTLDSKLDLCFLYRHFEPNYQSTFNNPFAENSDGKNESGFYFGLSYKPARAFTINSYIDFYKSSWLRYQIDAPSKGYDLLAEIQYNPSKVLSMYVRYKYENKQKNETNNSLAAYDVLAEQLRQQFRFHIKYKISLFVEAESRLEQSQFTTLNTATAFGTIIYQDLKMKLFKNKFTINTRLAMFDIDSYNARIYAFEDNVPYTYSVPMYQNSGVRFYLMTSYHLMKNVKFYARFSQTQYNNVKTIGSGLEQINGNTQSDLIMQLQMSF